VKHLTMKPKPFRRKQQGPSGTREFLTHATDPRAFVWPALLVTLVAFTILQFVTALRSSSEVSWRSVWLSIMVVWGVQWIILLLGKWSFLGRPWARRHPLIGVTFLFVAVLSSGLVSAALVSGESGTDGWTLLWRFFLSLTAIALWSVLQEYRQLVATEREVRTDLARVRAEGILQIDQERQLVVQHMTDTLLEGFVGLEDSEQEIAPSLRTLTRDYIRPLSHELITVVPRYRFTRTEKQRSLTWRELLDRLTSSPLVQPFAMALVVTTIFLLGTIETGQSMPNSVSDASDSGVQVTADIEAVVLSITRLLLIFMVTWVVSHVVLSLYRRYAANRSLIVRICLTGASPFGIALVVEVVVSAIYDTSDGFFVRWLIALGIFTVALLLLITRGIVALVTQAQESEVALTSELKWEIARVNETLRQERIFLAHAIHGPIQSRAAAASRRIDEAIHSGENVNEVFGEVRETLMREVVLLGAGPANRPSLATGLVNLKQTWTGVCDIEVHIQPVLLDAIDSDWITATTVNDVLINAVANAAMHGSASTVNIAAEMISPDELMIEILDNGKFSSGESAPGLGSVKLDEVAIQWSLNHDSESTKLQVMIPAPIGSATMNR